jgi:mannobiose 2-epimerase
MIFPSDEYFASDVRRELLENILPFWRSRCVDASGGFIAEMANDLSIKADANKGLILNGRLLWTFSAAYRYTHSLEDELLAHRAFEYLSTRFYDARSGGFFWELDPQGRFFDDKKKIYGQAFAIYALAEYYKTFAVSQSLELAQETFRHLEKHAFDKNAGGYFEVFTRDWKPCEDMRLSEKDMNEVKSMNNHLHILEAYANLLQVWPDDLLKERLTALVELFSDCILDEQQEHFQHFFDEDWRVKSDSYTYGHDIEGSWLLCEAAETLGDDGLIKETRAMALDVARAVLREGLDADGGLFYEGCEGRVINRSKEWWPQAEAVVGFWNAWQLSGDAMFKDAAMRSWGYIQDKIVDREHGEWFWRIDENGVVDDALPKISAWKCPYHNARCCLEILQRMNLKKILQDIKT